MAVGLAVAGLAVSVLSTGYSVYSANEQNDDFQQSAADALNSENRIAAKQGENADFAAELSDRREAISDQYIPAYGALVDEVQKKPNPAEEALPVTSSIVAGDSFHRQQNKPATDLTDTAPGTARRGAMDTGQSAATALDLGHVGPALEIGLEKENFQKRAGAIQVGKAYMGGVN